MTATYRASRIKALLTVSTVSFCLLATPVLAELTKAQHEPARSFAGAFLAADVARQDNDFAAASKYLSEALRYDPENRVLERELLVSLLTDGQFDEAVKVAERLKGEPDADRVARLALGTNALRSSDFERAQTELMLEDTSDLERLMTGIMTAWALQGQGKSSQAVELINALDGPDWFGLFAAYHSGLIAKLSGDEKQAAVYFDGALDDQAGGGASPLTFLRIAQARARMATADGQDDVAYAAIDKGLAIAPTNPGLLTLRSQIGTPEGAQDFISGPTDGAAEILLNLGSAINRDGAETFAALYLELARALAPNNDNILFELGSIAERLDQPLKAIDYYDQVPDGSALKLVAALQQGLNLADLDQTEQAITTLEELVAANPSDYRGYLALGGVHASEKNFEQAALVYEKALEHIDNEEPTFWPLHYRLAIAYERTKRWELAEPRFLKTLELSPNQPDVLNYLGYSWIDMNMNLERGLEMIRQAVELRPQSGYIVDSLGWAYYRLGRYEEAVEQLERAADLEPRDPTINDHLGDAYWRAGRKLEATFQWATSLDFKPEDELKAALEAKLAAANLAGVEPLVAQSVLDDPAAAKQALDAKGAESGDGG